MYLRCCLMFFVLRKFAKKEIKKKIIFVTIFLFFSFVVCMNIIHFQCYFVVLRCACVDLYLYVCFILVFFKLCFVVCRNSRCFFLMKKKKTNNLYILFNSHKNLETLDIKNRNIFIQQNKVPIVCVCVCVYFCVTFGFFLQKLAMHFILDVAFFNVFFCFNFFVIKT